MVLLWYIHEKENIKKAIELLKKSLDIQSSFCGENHPDTALLYDNLALGYSAEGDYKKSIELQQKALDIRLFVFGKNHIDTATSYSSLAQVYSKEKIIKKHLNSKKNHLISDYFFSVKITLILLLQTKILIPSVF